MWSVGDGRKLQPSPTRAFKLSSSACWCSKMIGPTSQAIFESSFQSSFSMRAFAAFCSDRAQRAVLFSDHDHVLVTRLLPPRVRKQSLPRVAKHYGVSDGLSSTGHFSSSGVFSSVDTAPTSQRNPTTSSLICGMIWSWAAREMVSIN